MKNMTRRMLCLTVIFCTSFTSYAVPNLNSPTTLPAHQGGIKLQPNITLPTLVDSQNRQDVANQCQNQCCIYNNVFYSEGSIVTVGNAILLQCARDANVAGANALRWIRLE